MYSIISSNNNNVSTIWKEERRRNALKNPLNPEKKRTKLINDEGTLAVYRETSYQYQLTNHLFSKTQNGNEKEVQNYKTLGWF